MFCVGVRISYTEDYFLRFPIYHIGYTFPFFPEDLKFNAGLSF